MILRICVRDLERSLFGLEELKIPALSDKVFRIPDVPIPVDTVFEGKQVIPYAPPFKPIVIQWNFYSGVTRLQEQLLQDSTLDSAVAWIYTESSSSSIDKFEAFSDGKELPMRGHVGFIVER